MRLRDKQFCEGAEWLLTSEVTRAGKEDKTDTELSGPRPTPAVPTHPAEGDRRRAVCSVKGREGRVLLAGPSSGPGRPPAGPLWLFQFHGYLWSAMANAFPTAGAPEAGYHLYQLIVDIKRFRATK